MPLDVTALAEKRVQLQSQADQLSTQLASIIDIESTVATDGLTLEEMLALKNLVYSDLPDATDTKATLDKLALALSAIDKVLAAQAAPAPTTP